MDKAEHIERMSQKTTSQAGERTRGLGTLTHPLKYGDKAMIKNTTLGGRIFDEGFATIIGATDTDDRYLVMFSNGDKVERFVSNDSNPKNKEGRLA